MPVFHTKTIESILEPVAQQVSPFNDPPVLFDSKWVGLEKCQFANKVSVVLCFER